LHPEIARIQDTKLLCEPDSLVLVGTDLVGLAGLAVGADSYIGGLATIVPRPLRERYDGVGVRRNLASARAQWNRLLPLVQFEYPALLSDAGQPHWRAVCREAAAPRGIPVGLPRLPMRSLSSDLRDELRRLLAELAEL